MISAAWATLHSAGDMERKEVHRSILAGDQSRAFYPLTLPLTVGPGSISVAITLGANAPLGYSASLAAIFGSVIGSAVIALSVYLLIAASPTRFARILGPTAMSIILRLSSFLLLCIGVQILWNGVRELLSSLSPSVL